MSTLKETRGDLVYGFAVPGQATAGTADEWAGFVCPHNAEITAVKWIPAAAVTANGTNYAVLSLRNRGTDGTGDNLVASRSYIATNSVAFKADTATLSATAEDRLVAAGEVLTFEKVNTGTGLAIPDGYVQVHLRWR